MNIVFFDLNRLIIVAGLDFEHADDKVFSSKTFNGSKIECILIY